MFGNLQSADDDRRTEHPFRQNRAKTVRFFALLFGMGAGLLVAAYFVGRPMLSKWRFDRDLKSATQYEADGDLRSAMLTLEQLNRLHPSNADVRRRLAAFYERVGQAESVTIWKEAVDLDPASAEGKLGLARAAIRFGDQRTARQTLEGFSGENSRTAEYHRLRVGLALLEKDVGAQEENLTALARLAPDDPRVRLSLAALHLRASQSAKASAARAVMLDLARGSQVRIRAVVELLGDVARRWPTPASERDATLKALADTLTPARGPLLELPSQVDHIDRLVAYAMTQPDPTPEDAVSLAGWMALNGHTEAALQWIDALPGTVARSPVVRTAMTEFAIRIQDWTRLQALLRDGAWGVVPTEAVEQAFRARRNFGQGVRSGSVAGWSSALEAAQGSPAALRMLLRLADLWGWPAEHRQVLQAIARNMPRETWAWRRLISDSLARGETEPLWQVYQEWRRVVPGDTVVQVETAIMGSLLGRRGVPDVTETAGYVRRQPADAGASVAHALALWRAGRPAEAAAVLDALPDQAFAEPRYALARGVVLAEVNRARESEVMLDRASADLLLPEERELVRQTRERNRATPADR